MQGSRRFPPNPLITACQWSARPSLTALWGPAALSTLSSSRKWRVVSSSERKYEGWREVKVAVKENHKLQALVYDILPSTPSTGLRHPSFNSKHWFTTSFLQLQALVYDILPSTPSIGLRHPSFNSKHWFTTSFLQPLPYLVTP